MSNVNKLSGVFAAVVTPLKNDLSPDLDGLINLIQFLANRGCHGVLLMGTTGEGPSFSVEERLLIVQTAVSARKDLPDFQFLAGTGTPSLEETIYLTKTAFELEVDGVVVLPPFYFRKPSDDGLFNWFSDVIQKSVPDHGLVLGYHIPQVTGVNFSLELLSRLRDAFPRQFLGIKDSSGDPEWARSLGDRFAGDLTVLNGNDRLFNLALKSKANGCITAMANLLSPLHRIIWENFHSNVEAETTQEKLSTLRGIFDRYPPMPPMIKLALSRLHGFPLWRVKPPLLDFDSGIIEPILTEFKAALE